MSDHINKIFEEHRFLSLCRNITAGSDLADDLLQHCAIRIYEKGFTPDSRKGNLYVYFKTMAQNEWNHPSSKFNQVYRNRVENKLLRDVNLHEIEEKSEVDSNDNADRYNPDYDNFKLKYSAILESETPMFTFREWLDKRLDRKASDEREYFLQQIFIAYLRLGTIDEVSKATTICKSIVTSAVKTYKTQIENDYRNSDHY